MDPSVASDLAREAVLIGLLISAPVLAAGLIVGLAIGLLQALTQIQEQTVSFVPKLLAMVAALTLTMPWMISLMTEYVRTLFEGIPGTFE
jgi:flagellar biosynthetic protein FliQ